MIEQDRINKVIKHCVDNDKQRALIVYKNPDDRDIGILFDKCCRENDCKYNFERVGGRNVKVIRHESGSILWLMCADNLDTILVSEYDIITLYRPEDFTKNESWMIQRRLIRRKSENFIADSEDRIRIAFNDPEHDQYIVKSYTSNWRKIGLWERIRIFFTATSKREYELTRDNLEAERINAELVILLKSASTTNTVLQNEHEYLKKNRDELQDDFNNINNENGNITKVVEMITLDSEAWEGRYNKALIEGNRYAERVVKLQKEVSEVLEHSESVEDQLDKSKDQLAKAKNEAKQAKRIATIAKSKATKLQDVINITDEADLSERLNDARNKIVKFEGQIAAKDSDIIRIRRDYTDLQYQLDSATQEVKDLKIFAGVDKLV